MRRRRAAGIVLGLAFGATRAPARAEDLARRPLAVEARVGLVADATLGDARRVIDDAFGLSAGASVHRVGSPWRGRLTLGGEPVTNIGPGASLALFEARLGVERSWRHRLLAAFDVGGAARRLSVADALTRWTPGLSAALEVGARFRLDERWSLATGARLEIAWFTRDLFLWEQAGLFLTVERAAHGRDAAPSP